MSDCCETTATATSSLAHACCGGSRSGDATASKHTVADRTNPPAA